LRWNLALPLSEVIGICFRIFVWEELRPLSDLWNARNSMMDIIFMMRLQLLLLTPIMTLHATPRKRTIWVISSKLLTGACGRVSTDR
jgi:hypothetical protein